MYLVIYTANNGKHMRLAFDTERQAVGVAQDISQRLYGQVTSVWYAGERLAEYAYGFEIVSC